MNTEFFKKCEFCNKNIYIYKGVPNDVVSRNDIKVWHYDCKIQDSRLPDDLAVRVFHCTGPMDGDYVISYMTENAVKNIEHIYPNSFNLEIVTSIIRTPISELEQPKPICNKNIPKNISNPFDDEWEPTVWDCISSLGYKLSQIPYKLKNRFIKKPSVVETSLNKYEYHDLVNIMLYSNMDAFKKFYEEEVVDGIVCWDSDDYSRHVKKEMDAIYTWWKNYPNRLKENEEMLHHWYVNKGNWFTKPVEDDPQLVELVIDSANEIGETAFKKLREMENELDKETEDMLIRLVRIRQSLWT